MKTKLPNRMNLTISPKEKCFKYVDYETNEITSYPLDVELMDANFFDKFEKALAELFENTYLGSVNSFNIIIPDEYYAYTTVFLPRLKQGLSIQNLRTELSARFKNVNELDFEFFVIAESQNSNLFLVRYIRKNIFSQFHKTFSNLKKDLMGITSRSVQSTKTLFAYEPKLKQRNFIVFDIHEEVTNVTICENTNIVSYYQFEFGTNILSTTSITREESLFNHRPAQLAVAKAKASAKAKKGVNVEEPTVADDDDEISSTSATGDEFETIMQNWDLFLKQIENILDNDFFYKNHIKFDDIIFNMPQDLHYIIDNTSLESEVDETGMEVKRQKKVVNTLERKQPYAKKPQLRKREFATFTKQDKKNIQLRPVDLNDLAVCRK